MSKLYSLPWALVLLLLSPLSLADTQPDQQAAPATPMREVITIASGSNKGIYFQVASEICRLTSAGKAQHGLRCGAIPTDGSAENLALLLAGEVDFAIVQSDVLYFAHKQYPSRLKGVIATHAEPLTIVTAAGTGIDQAIDLSGAALNIDHQESGTNQSLRRLIGSVKNWTTAPTLLQESNWDAFESLCLGEIDAYAAIMGHPNRLVNQTSKRCDISFVPINPAMVADENGDLPPYIMAGKIPGRLYRGNKQATESLAFSANLVTRADVPPAYVAAVVKAVFQTERSFGKNITAYANIFRTPKHMTGNALVIPIHPVVPALVPESNNAATQTNTSEQP